MLTVSRARKAVEEAHYNYITVNGGGAELIIAKETLDNARHDYHKACETLVDKLTFAKDLADVHNELVKQGVWSE